MRTVAAESRAFVLSSNQCVRKKHLPQWISVGKPVEAPTALTRTRTNTSPSRRRKSVVKEDTHELVLPEPDNAINGDSAIAEEDTTGDEFVCRGGSCIVDPLGNVLAGSLWEVEDGFLSVEVDFEDCERGRLDMDVAGSYSRNDAFHLQVDGLDLNPPPL